MFKCTHGQCEYTTGHAYRLDLHARVCKGSTPLSRTYACDQCDRAFSNPTILRQDKETHSDANTRICPHCGEALASHDDVSRHFRRVHDGIDDGPIRCTCADESDPECPSPDYLWSAWGRLRAHLIKYHRLQNVQMVTLLGPRILGGRYYQRSSP